ncbi:pre-rRNA processing protein [Malassezia cuniculi]|uniref:Pre-rRNA processing protein n=1 Tax=Malassezia cuniculi TaxID=948313 RepID=A0AAF0JAC5_9BASI|nr:pre-rRNA processing protein [Malassezia cuniculi]
MPDPFFQKKRKRASRTRDEDDGSGDEAVEDLDLRHRYGEVDDGSDAEAAAAETAAEAKVRLARMYLDGLHQRTEEGIDAAEVDRENIAARLHKDVQEHSGHIHIFVAHRIRAPEPRHILAVRGHRAAVTAACGSDGSPVFFSADKSGRIIEWSLRDGRQVAVLPASGTESAPESHTSGAARRRAHARMKGKFPVDANGPKKMHIFEGCIPLSAGEGHTKAVLSLSLSNDGRYLASAGRDKRIGVWYIAPHTTPERARQGAVERTRWLRALTGHKDAVRTVAFRQGSLELFSASYDRTVKLFDVSQLSYIETLFGHQESIMDLACLRAERAVSAGGRERTCRLWKIREESQLVFRGGAKSKMRDLLEGGDLVDTRGKNEVHEGSIDCITMIDDHHFLCGSDSGTISLWSAQKKKPIYTKTAAHGFDESREGPLPRYITSIACLPYGDVFATGSWDGKIRLWALNEQLTSFSFLHTIDAPGVVNSLQLITPAIESVAEYPVEPELWRRRGGLDAPLGPAPTADSTAAADASLVDRNTIQRANGRVIGHKETIAPLLIAAVSSEPRADRWLHTDSPNGVLVVPFFNQDFSCIAVGSQRGYAIANCEPFSQIFSQTDDEPVAQVEMLFSTSLVALVPLSDAPGRSSPRTVKIVNTKRRSTICELHFPSMVLGVHMNRRRLVVVLDTEIYIYDISTMKLLHTVATGPNPAGLCSLSTSENCLFAYATVGSLGSAPGDVYIYDALALEVVTVVHAHKAPIASIALNRDATLLATASEKGTIIRVFSLPSGRLVHHFRRGTYAAHIHSITFSYDSTFVCVTSDSGTVHLFRIEADNRAPEPNAALAHKRKGQLNVADALGSYLPSALTEMWEPARSFAHFKLPTRSHAVAAISASLPIALAATSDGRFFTYGIDLEKGGECILQRQSSLLMDSI